MIQDINPVQFALKDKSADELMGNSSFFGNVSIYGWVFFGLLILVIILGYWKLYKVGQKNKKTINNNDKKTNGANNNVPPKS